MPVRSPLRTIPEDEAPRRGQLITAPTLSAQDVYSSFHAGDNELQKGIDRGLRQSTTGEMYKAALAAEAIGDPNWEAQRADAARLSQQNAEIYAPRVGSLRDINGIGDAMDYAASSFGQGIASMGPTLAGSLAAAALTRGNAGLIGKVAPYLGAAVPGYQMEAGEAAQTQYEDPALAAASVEDRVAAMRVKGLTNMALETIVPGGLAKSILRAPTRGFLAGVGKNALTEGATETAQEYVGHLANKYLDPNQQLDGWQMADAFASGALTGGGVSLAGHAPSHLAGALADRLPSRGDPNAEAQAPAADPGLDPVAPAPGDPSMGERAADIFNSVRDKYGPVVKDTVDNAKEYVEGVLDRGSEAAKAGAAPGDVLGAMFRRSASDDAAELTQHETEDPSVLGAADPAEALAARPGRLEATATRLAQSILDDPATPEPLRAKVEAMGGDFSSTESQLSLGAAYTSFTAGRKIVDAVGSIKDWGSSLFEARNAKQNLQDLPVTELKPVVDLLAERMGPDHAAEAPQVARQLVAFANRANSAATITPAVAARLSSFSEAVGDDVLEAVTAVSGNEALRGAITKIRDIPSAVSDFKNAAGNSFFESMLAPGADTTMLPAVAQFVDGLGTQFKGMNEHRKTASMTALASVFGTTENAQAVVEYYGNLRSEAFKAEAEAGKLAEDRTVDAAPLGDAIGKDDVIAGTLTEHDKPRYQAHNRAPNPARPFSKMTDRSELAQKLKELGPGARKMSLRDYVENYTDESPQVHAGRIRADLRKRLTDEMNRDTGTVQKAIADLESVPEADRSKEMQDYIDSLKKRKTEDRPQLAVLKRQAAAIGRAAGVKFSDVTDMYHRIKRAEDARDAGMDGGDVEQIPALRKQLAKLENKFSENAGKVLDRYHVAVTLADDDALMGKGKLRGISDDTIATKFRKLLDSKKSVMSGKTDEERAQITEANAKIDKTRIGFKMKGKTAPMYLSAESMVFNSPGRGDVRTRLSESIAGVLLRADVEGLVTPKPDTIVRRNKDGNDLLWSDVNPSTEPTVLGTKREFTDKEKAIGDKAREKANFSKNARMLDDADTAPKFRNALVNIKADFLREKLGDAAPANKSLSVNALIALFPANARLAVGREVDDLAYHTAKSWGQKLAVRNAKVRAEAREAGRKTTRDEYLNESKQRVIEDYVADELELRIPVQDFYDTSDALSREAENSGEYEAEGAIGGKITFYEDKIDALEERLQETVGLTGLTKKFLNQRAGAIQTLDALVDNATDTQRDTRVAGRREQVNAPERAVSAELTQEQIDATIAKLEARMAQVKESDNVGLTDNKELVDYTDTMLRDLDKRMETAKKAVPTNERLDIREVIDYRSESFAERFLGTLPESPRDRTVVRGGKFDKNIKPVSKSEGAAQDIAENRAHFREMFNRKLGGKTDKEILSDGKYLNIRASKFFSGWTLAGKTDDQIHLAEMMAEEADMMIARVPELASVLKNLVNMVGFVAPQKPAATKPAAAKPAATSKVVLPGDGPYLAKDQAKSDKANKFIGRGSDRSSTHAYANAWGMRGNTHSYTDSDTVFISAEGNRAGRMAPNFREIQLAVDANATFITDVKAARERPFNVGERAVAEYLSSKGYSEHEGVWWNPNPKGEAATKPARPNEGWQAHNWKQEIGGLKDKLARAEDAKDTARADALREELRAEQKQYDEWTAEFTGLDEQIAASVSAAQKARAGGGVLAKGVEAKDGHSQTRSAIEKQIEGASEAELRKLLRSQQTRLRQFEDRAQDKGAGVPAQSWAAKTAGFIRGEIALIEKQLAGTERANAEQNAKQSTIGDERPTPSADQVAKDRAAITAEIRRTRGHDVDIRFNRLIKELGASGEFSTDKNGEDRRIEVALNAANPLHVAWHESLHDFFHTLLNDRNGRNIKRDLTNAASSPQVMKRLRKLLENHPAAITQIEDSMEERVAYMYQFWAAGKLEVGPTGTGMLRTIQKFFRDILGIVGRDERAADLLTALHEGKFADPSTVGEVLADLPRDTVINRLERFNPALTDTMSKLAQTAPDRLRAYQNDTLNILADMFSSEKGELGFIQRRSRQEGIWENRLDAMLKGTTAVERSLAAKNRHAMLPPSNKLERDLVKLFEDMHDYLSEAKVETLDSATKKWVPLRKVTDYFPRTWDKHAISKNRDKFRDLLMKHGKMPAKQANATIDMLMGGTGQADLAESDHALGFTPFANAVQDRKLTFIDKSNAAEFADFQSKDLGDILKVYTKQAVHRGEYARAFGNNGEIITQLLIDSKITDPKDLTNIGKIVRGLEGSLGYDMSVDTKELYSSILTLQNLVILPVAIFSQMVDPIVLAARSGDIKDAGRAYMAGLKGLLRQKVDGEDLAEMLGTISQETVLEAMGVAYGSSHMSHSMRKINRTFFKWNGMQGWNNAMRISATVAGERYLLQNKGNPAALKELGLTAADITTYQSFTTDPMNAGKMIRKDRLDVTNPKVQEAMFRFVDQAVLRPSASNRPVWMSDPKFILLAHLKQFTFAMHNVVLKRANTQLDDGNVKPWLTLMLAAPVMLAADMAKFAFTGMPPGWGASQLLSHSIERSGLLGLGDFGAQALNDAGRGKVPGESLLGPSIEHLLMLLRFLGGSEAVGAGDLIKRTVPLARFT